MYEDNISVFDHLLNQRQVEQDGKFRLYGEPKNDCLQIKLIVEHQCHGMRIGRGDEKLNAFSTFSIKADDLIRNDYDLEMNIELAGSQVQLSSILLPIYRAWLYGTRAMLDTLRRLKNLDLWSKV